uniref:type II secretion system protein GspC n=1 Tax=Ningiella ruwaisensis TaxID=2364274 RepID=UPI0010A0857F|nr:type II secretion system protein GspC [Ningiella ruwaisensis]
MTLETRVLTPVSRFYQENDQKIILMIVIILSLYLVSLAAKLTWRILPQPELATRFEQNLSVSGNIGTQSNKTNLDKLLALNLFGDASAKPVEVQEVTDAPETKLNLVLSGVVASTAENGGAAVIEYRNNQNTYGIGDKIEGTQVTLDEIYADRVIIKNRATRETLMLEGLDFEEANRLREQNAPIESGQSQTPQTVASRGGSVAANPRASQFRQVQEKLRAEPASFTDYIRLLPYQEDGMILGYRVSPGKDPALFNDIGLKDGDVVIELNGYDLSDNAQASEAVTLLNDASTLDLEVIRNDEYISLSLDIPRDE